MIIFMNEEGKKKIASTCLLEIISRNLCADKWKERKSGRNEFINSIGVTHARRATSRIAEEDFSSRGHVGGSHRF